MQLSTVSTVLLFGSINFFWIRSETIEVLSSGLEARARHHAESIAAEAQTARLPDRGMLLTKLVADTRSHDPAISHIAIVDRSGELLENNTGDHLPVELRGVLPPARSGYAVRRFRNGSGQEILDVTAPIAGGSTGFVHVGLRTDLLARGVSRVERAVGLMVGIFVSLGLLASLLFTRAVTKPLETLAMASSRLNLDALSGAESHLADLLPRSSSGVGLETEVDRLADAFQRMVRRLSAAYGELEDARKQLLLAERLGTLGTVAAGLAHELNNPLAGLKNCLRRIQKEPENQEQLQRYVSLMRQSVDRMQVVLRGLLDLASPRQPEKTTVRLAPLLERVVLLAGNRLAEIGAPHRIEVDPAASVVQADERLLEEVLLNLVLNACDSLKRRRQSDPQFPCKLVLRTSNPGGQPQIEVEDNGVGIPPEDLPRLFDPFFTTKAPGEGTGLGLPIARDIIRLHDGDILVESLPGAGASFKVVLPKSREA